MGLEAVDDYIRKVKYGTNMEVSEERVCATCGVIFQIDSTLPQDECDACCQDEKEVYIN